MNNRRPIEFSTSIPRPFLIALVLASISFWISTRHNDFPKEYHPDEPTKVAQLLGPSQERNFNHPLLMLEAANSARVLLGVGDDERAVLALGRRTSAVLAAIAVFGLAFAGYCTGGYPGLLLCGAIVALCPALVVYAHFFKEDTALLAGLGITIAGATWLTKANQQWAQGVAAVVMGVGFAAASSGKYVGAAALFPCVMALVFAAKGGPGDLMKRIACFAVPAFSLLLLINFRAFENFILLTPTASSKVTDEFLHGVTGHDDLTLGIPNAFLFRVSVSELLPDVWLFFAIGVLLTRVRSLVLAELVGPAFLLTFIFVLTCSAFPFARYALPTTVLAYFVAGQMISCALRRYNESRLKSIAITVSLALIVIFQGNQIWLFNTQFADDSRQRLREWVANHIEEQETILAEDFTTLDEAGDSWRYPHQNQLRAKIIRVETVADRSSTLEQLKMSGIDYVAVAEPKYERYFRVGIRSITSKESDLVLRHRLFYADLFARAELVWSSVPTPPSHAYLNPELRLYRLPDVNVATRRSQEIRSSN